MTALLFAGVLLAGCGDKRDEDRQESAAPVSPADEAQAQREADENRKRFMGDGKARYTPQSIESF
ncbi:hypothetical protein L505_0556 [Bordetella bronchiseptica F4563]|uniref:hypothetical protein n=1 Tax=Bordetella bronchiseptica TaxID=518 RepID=UPI0004611376|nr:hypothetical protein [Bordetella bronchiseptica]KDC32853.1 hypothetical protein L505_0556 [Bordetella bronchiseptica F4563]